MLGSRSHRLCLLKGAATPRRSECKIASEVRRSPRYIARRHGVPTGWADESTDGLLREVQRAAGRAFAPLARHSAFEALEWPAADTRRLVQKELGRRLPTEP